MTSYCLGDYEETKDIKYCNEIFQKNNDKYKRGGGRFIKALQSFKMLMGKVDKLIAAMELTDEVLNTQFYDKFND